MIRYYPTNSYMVVGIDGKELPLPSHVANNGEGYIVTAKRKPRGYVIPVTKTVAERNGDGTYEAVVRHQIVSGWRAVGLDDYVGKFRDSKDQATHALVSGHRYRLIVECQDCRSTFWDGQRCFGWLLNGCLKEAATIAKRHT